MSRLPDKISEAIGTVHEVSDPRKLIHEPRVTVYMAVYNHAPYLERAIRGVLTQTNVSLEILVGEDNSDDESLALARKFHHKRPDLIRILTGNRNIGSRLNFCRAMEHARGQFVAFCEGDDWWVDPHKLRKQLALFDTRRDVGAVHSDYLVAYPIGEQWKLVRRLWKFKPPNDPRELTEKLFSRIFSSFPFRTCTAVYRREVIEGFLGSSLLSADVAAGDRALAGYCAAHWRVRYLDSPTSVYRVSPGSATRMGDQANIELYRGIVRLYERFRRVYGDRPDFDHSFAGTCYPVLAVKAVRIGDFEEFDHCLAEMRYSSRHGTWRLLDLGIRSFAKWPPALSAAVRIWDLKTRWLDHLFLMAVRYLNLGVVDSEGSSAPRNTGKAGSS